VVKLNEKPK